MGSILLAFVAADLISGIYHWLTDHGWNLRHQVDGFQQHHRDPRSLTFDLSPVLGGLPLAAVACLGWQPVFWVSLGLFVALTQVCHYYAHHPAPRPVQLLQRFGILISPEHHGVHHRGDFSLNYCVVSGWNNGWLNWLLECLAKR